MVQHKRKDLVDHVLG
eukprot:UN27153